MITALTLRQWLAMGYARLHALRDDLGTHEVGESNLLRADFNRALDDLQAAGINLAAFKLDEVGTVEDLSGVLRARLNAVLDYLDLMAGLP